MLLPIFHRVVHTIGVMIVVVTLVFAMIHLSGDPLAALIPPGGSESDQQALRAKYGLDASIGRQYAEFLRNAARGDFGQSWRFNEPARDVVLNRLPATFELVGLSFGLAVLVAIPLGVLASSGTASLSNSLYYGVSLFGQAVPAFWLGTLMILIFAVRLDWVPSSGNQGLRATILPVLTLAAYPTAVLARMVKASVLEVARLDYVRTARAKGLSERAVMFAHVLRNATPPIVAYAGVLAGFLFAGTVVVEWVFAYPGAGQLALQSVASRDLPVVLMFVTVTALIITIANFLADLISMLIDPRLRFEYASAGEERR
ncbi:ABC transporter permease [soil metagenome]